MSEPTARALREPLGISDVFYASSAEEFADAPRDSKTVSFVDAITLPRLDEVRPPPGPVIAFSDDTLAASLVWFRRPWLSHVIATSLLAHPMATDHLANVMKTLTKGERPRLLDWLGGHVSGRRVRVSQASRRAERLQRMTEFFVSKGVDSYRIDRLRETAEELLVNAFYKAPVAAGVVGGPIARTQDVSLPDDKACDMVYGSSDDVALVRVRDPFGSLSRLRLWESLRQVQTGEVVSTGLSRVLASASFVAISVIDYRSTEILVGIGTPVTMPPPYAFHLFFRGVGGPVRKWKLLDQQTGSLSDNSITILSK
jgi:hypothetical protein